jgi:DivIVA domain-containing protein
MKSIFSPEEIELKKFVIRWRGYDAREVEAFLRAVAVDFRRLIDRAAAADQPTSTGDELAQVRDELNRLSSRLDQTLAALETGGLSEEAGRLAEGSARLVEESGRSIEPADESDSTQKADLRLLVGAAGAG